MVEAELCAAASDVLMGLGFRDFAIRLNHRLLLTAVLERSGIPADQHGDALVALDKLDKIGPEGVERELAERGLGADVAATCLTFLAGIGRADPAEKLALSQVFLDGSEDGRRAISEVIEIADLLKETPHIDRIRFDPSLARGLSYYTGAIMEISVPDLAGSLGGGGRYDNLIGMFLGRNVPACGFSLGLERILVVMGERAMFPESVVRASADVMVTLWNSEAQADALALAAVLRADGLRVDVYPEPDKLGKQFKYAAARQVSIVTVVGDDERVRGDVTVKDMRTGQQQRVPRDTVADHVNRLLGRGIDSDLKMDAGL